MNCPKCGSTGWKSLSVIHAEGTSSENETTSIGGVGIGSGGNIGVLSGSSESSRQTQSQLAAAAAPPVYSEEDSSGCLVLSFIIGIGVVWYCWHLSIALAILWVIVLPILAIWVHGLGEEDRKKKKEEKEEYDKEMEEWLNSAMCLRCGEIFKMP